MEYRKLEGGNSIRIVKRDGNSYFNLGDIFSITYPGKIVETLITAACIPGDTNLTESLYLPGGDPSIKEIFQDNRNGKRNYSYREGIAKDIYVNASTMFVLFQEALERDDPDSPIIESIYRELEKEFSDDILTSYLLTHFPWSMDKSEIESITLPTLKESL